MPLTGALAPEGFVQLFAFGEVPFGLTSRSDGVALGGRLGPSRWPSPQRGEAKGPIAPEGRSKGAKRLRSKDLDTNELASLAREVDRPIVLFAETGKALSLLGDALDVWRPNWARGLQRSFFVEKMPLLDPRGSYAQKLSATTSRGEPPGRQRAERIKASKSTPDLSVERYVASFHRLFSQEVQAFRLYLACICRPSASRYQAQLGMLDARWGKPSIQQGAFGHCRQRNRRGNRQTGRAP